MSIFSNIFKKQQETETENTPAKKNVEDFMSFIRIYLQASMAANLGITNIKMVPELAMFKRTLKIQTVNNKLGVAERTKARKIIQTEYGIRDVFFEELDASLKKKCKTQMAIQSYSMQFQEYLNNLLTVVTSLMKWQMQIPSFMKDTLRSATEKTIHDIMTKTNWKKPDIIAAVFNLKKQSETLGFSEAWMSEFMYNLILLAKKEKRKKEKI